MLSWGFHLACVCLLTSATIVQAMPSVLVYTRTVGYRHESIPTAIASLGQQGPTYGVTFTFSEDPALFTDDGLERFDGIMFVSNSDEVLDATGKTALLSWLQKGGALVAIHSGCACLFEEDFFRKQVGALFDYHPELQLATFLPLNKTHPAMTMVPDRWSFEEEVYYFRSDPRTVGATVLMTVDNSSYQHTGSSTGNYNMGSPHPIAWYQDHGAAVDDVAHAGRSFFTSLGHTNETWTNDTFLAHVMEGLLWTLQGGKTLAFTSDGQVGNATRSDSSTSAVGSTTSASATTSSVTGPTSSKTSRSSFSASASPPSSTTSGADATSRSSGSLMELSVAGSLFALALSV